MVNPILIFAPNWIGDAVMATPLLRAIKNYYPDVPLHVVAKKSICELLNGLPYIDEYFPLPNKPSQQISFAIKLRKNNYSTIFILPHSFRSAFLSFLIGAHIRIGYDCNSRRFLLTHAISFPQDKNGNRKIQYMTYEYLKLGEPLNIVPDDKGLELAVPGDEELAWQQELEAENIKGPLVGIAPGASFGPSKRWDIERFAKVATELHKKYNALPILITGPEEQELKDNFEKHCETRFLDPSKTNHSLSRLKAVIKSLDLLICNDSGPRHIAIAFGVPVICIMGPTKPEYTESPWERGTVLRVPVECGPCQLPECPTDHRCMKQITPETVLLHAEPYLRYSQ